MLARHATVYFMAQVHRPNVGQCTMQLFPIRKLRRTKLRSRSSTSYNRIAASSHLTSRKNRIQNGKRSIIATAAATRRHQRCLSRSGERLRLPAMPTYGYDVLAHLLTIDILTWLLDV